MAIAEVDPQLSERELGLFRDFVAGLLGFERGLKRVVFNNSSRMLESVGDGKPSSLEFVQVPDRSSVQAYLGRDFGSDRSTRSVTLYWNRGDDGRLQAVLGNRNPWLVR
ncbi:hypothetical protein HYS93_03140 [Candidatus Daviesbacteria bacterium]|nr:hypothetical protein [Candidatus Daviesbacteria bacterium]